MSEQTTSKENSPLTVEEKWNKRKNTLVFLLVILAATMTIYYALGAIHLGLGLVVFLLALVFKPITG